MVQWVNIVLVGLAALLVVPVAVFCVECLAALLPRRRGLTSGSTTVATGDRRLAVLIPAHNEEATLGATLASLGPQLRGGDRILLVADNCDDATAQVAREHGADVVERKDARRLGKGYALDYGIRHLEQDPPAVVVMIDADCRVAPGTIDALVRQVQATSRPAQAVYLLECGAEYADPRRLASTLAFLIKNLVRPVGLMRLHLPCLLTGTGMAFPWETIKRADLASGNIVEDMQLGLDLTLAGHAPLLCEGARVTGTLPQQRASEICQRTRWEHGHLHTLLTQVPRLLTVGLLRLRPAAVGLALELCVPPLSLLVVLLGLATLAALGAGLLGATWWPAVVLGVAAVALAGCVIAVWAKFARGTLPLRALLAAPFYVVGKLPVYARFPLRRQTEWVRTARPARAVQSDTPPAPGAA